jgi:hypothetical protein
MDMFLCYFFLKRQKSIFSVTSYLTKSASRCSCKVKREAIGPQHYLCGFMEKHAIKKLHICYRIEEAKHRFADPEFHDSSIKALDFEFSTHSTFNFNFKKNHFENS